MINVKKKRKQKVQPSWTRMPDKFIDLPDAANVTNLPDIEAFDEKSIEQTRPISRWEWEGGKVL